jgi:hypothetical protein
MSDYRWGLDWWLDLLATYTHDWWLRVITAPPLISTIHKSPQQPLCLSQLAVFTSRSLETVSNNGDSSASRAHVVTVQRIRRNCQLKYSAISSQPPLQSSTQLPTLNWTLSLTNQLLHFTSFHSTQLNYGIFKVKAALRLEVYRQSVCLGVKLFETHDQRSIFSNLTLAVIVLM